MTNQALFINYSRDLRKLFKYFNETKNSAFNLLLLSDGSLQFLFYTQKTYLLLSCYYLSYNYEQHYFH